jgi:hypothetical protein
VHAAGAADCAVWGMRLVRIEDQLENEWLRSIVFS